MTHSDQIYHVHSHSGAVFISLCIENRFRVRVCFILFVQYHCMRWTKTTMERIRWYSSRSHRLRLFHSIIEPTAVNRFGFSTPAAFVLQMRRFCILQSQRNVKLICVNKWQLQANVSDEKIEKRLWHLCWNIWIYRYHSVRVGGYDFFPLSIHSSRRSIKLYVRFWTNSIIAKIRI